MAVMELVLLYATLAGLTADFHGVRHAERAATAEEFLRWLMENNHQQLAEQIRNNQGLLIGLKALFNEGHDEMMKRFESLDRAVASLTSGMEAFGSISAAVHPESQLSEQALAILRAVEARRVGKFLEINNGCDPGVTLLPIDGTGNGPLEITEDRFIDDDLTTLVSLRLLRQDWNQNHQRLFRVTRLASQVVRGR